MRKIYFLKVIYLLIPTFLLSSCFLEKDSQISSSTKNRFIENRSMESLGFINSLLGFSDEPFGKAISKSFKFNLITPDETKTFDNFIEVKEEYFPSALKTWKINGYIEQPPWYAYDIHVTRGDNVYGRFCVIKILKKKVNLMQCYLSSRELNDHFGKKLPLQDLNEMYVNSRQSSVDYNNHIDPNCVGQKKNKGVEYIKYYPTRVDQVRTKEDNSCKMMQDYFESADPSTLKTRVWINDPWVMEDIHFSSSYKAIERIGVNKVNGKEVSLIHNYIPMEGHLFREYMINIEVPENIGELLPPALDTDLERLVARSQYQPLFHLNKEGEINPLLATSFQWGPQRQRLTISLNPLARFSDGSYLTGEDIKRSWYSVFKINETRKKNRFNSFFRKLKGMDKAISLDRFDGMKVVGTSKVILYFNKKQKKFPKVLTRPEMSPYKEKGGEKMGTGPYIIVKNNKPFDSVVLWPNNFYYKSEKALSLRFISQKTEDEKLKKMPIDVKLQMTNEKSTRCSVGDPSWRCLRLHLDFSSQNTGWTVEFNTRKISPYKEEWSRDPMNFYWLSDRDGVHISPLKTSEVSN